jgi:hypothetical protein
MMQEQTQEVTKPMIPREFAQAFHNNQNILSYFNPYNYAKAQTDTAPEESSPWHNLNDELRDIEIAIDKCVGYETTPICMVGNNRELGNQEPLPRSYNAIGIKKAGDIMYRALITWSREPNSLGTETLRYWVTSPFIRKDRCNSEPPPPYDITNYGAIRTNSLKKAVQEVLKYPALPFETIIGYRYKDMEHMTKEVLKTDETALKKEVYAFLGTLSRIDSTSAGVANWLAHALTGNMQTLPESASLVLRAQQHLETIKPLYEQMEESNLLTAVFVSQFGNNDVARCYTVKALPKEAVLYYNPAGVVDKLAVYETANAIPSTIKSKLAALQINEANMTNQEWAGYKYIPNLGVFMLDRFFNTSGRHGMVFLNPAEFIEAFPDE